jgi:hypothetical protein
MCNTEMTQELTADQLVAVTTYAAEHGRNWKSALREAWMTGIYDDFQGSNFLQQIRNTFGPTWLIRFRLPKAGKSQMKGGA